MKLTDLARKNKKKQEKALETPPKEIKKHTDTGKLIPHPTKKGTWIVDNGK